MKRLIITAAVASAMALGAVAQVNSPSREGYDVRAAQMYADGNYVGCIDQMSYLMKHQPTDAQRADAEYYIAMSNAHLGRTDAMTMLRHFVWRYPTDARGVEVRLTIAELLGDQGRWADALAAYDEINARSLNPDMGERYTYGKAYCLLNDKRYDEAQAMYQSLRQSPQYARGAMFYEGYIAYVRGDYESAARILRAAASNVAPGNMAEFYLAQIYYHDGDYNRAASAARKLLSRDVDESFKVEASRIAGESLYHLGNDAEAAAYLHQYVDSVADPAMSALYILGVTDYRLGEYAEAITHLTPVAALDDAMGQSANLFIGQALMQQANYTSAMIAFDKALRMDYDSAVSETAYYNYAVASTEGGSVPFGSSVTTFEEFLRRYPNSRYAPAVSEFVVAGYMTDSNYAAALNSINAIAHPSDKILAAKQQVLYALGTRELAANRPAEAAKHLTEAINLGRYNAEIAAEATLWLGEAEYAQGRYDKAIANYKSYLSGRKGAAVNKPTAYYDMAYAYFSDGAYTDALDAFGRFVGAPGQSAPAMIADAYNRIGDCYYVKAMFAEASQAYDKAYTTAPATADYALYQEAIMKGHQRDYAAKVSAMQRMMQQFPTSSLVPQALIETGEAYEQLKQGVRAIDVYAEAYERFPATPQGRNAALLLALAQNNAGKRDAAIDTYRSLIMLAPTSAEARQAVDNLRQLMVADGRIGEFTDFLASVPGMAPVDDSEIESMTFTAAEREYLETGKTDRLKAYLAQFPTGASRGDALSYALRGAIAASDTKAMLAYADDIIANHPHHRSIESALSTKADIEYGLGNGEAALEAYTRLAEVASTPIAANEARIGVLRTARDLGLNARVIEAADAITSSSTVSTEQRNEARFSRAMANAALGNSQAATDEWIDLADNTDDIYGVRAAYQLAASLFDEGELLKSRSRVEKLVASKSPHVYWIARGFILLSDINRAEGNDYEAEQYLMMLKSNYPGKEVDIFNMIEERLNRQ